MKSRYSRKVKFEPREIDPAMFGLKYEFQAYLAEHDVVWFQDYSAIEVDATNHELKVVLTCEFDDRLKKLLKDFGDANNLPFVYYWRERGVATLKRVGRT